LPMGAVSHGVTTINTTTDHPLGERRERLPLKPVRIEAPGQSICSSGKNGAPSADSQM
jgi:hypothetical protein